MIKSMTAYAQASAVTELGKLSCELRSVNHRYLEIAPRLPEELRALESDLREAIQAKLARGRIDCFLRLQQNEITNLEPNNEITENLADLVKQMQNKLPDMSPIRAIDVLRWPGVLQGKKMDIDAMRKNLLEVVNKATDGLIEARQQEGSKIAELIHQRLNGMRESVNNVTIFLPEIAENYRQRLEQKMTEIKDQLDPARLEQEMIIFLQKTDVAEELDRLTVHLDEVASTIDKAEPCGRRLDFLMQELNRETNTLGSKAQDPRLTKASVDMKVLIEQMREQVQNIE